MLFRSNANADGAGYTALHAAIVRGNLNVVKALLAHGANPNARQTKGTPARRYSGFALDKTMIGATDRKVSRLQREVQTLRHEVSRLRAR